jgi:DNA-binding NtrC family response regulator
MKRARLGCSSGVTETAHERVLRARIDLPFKDVKDELLGIFEREYVIAALERHDMNLSAASRETGLSRKHLRHLMRKHHLGTARRLIDDE